MNFHQLEIRILDRQIRRGLSGQEVQAHLVWQQEETPLAYDPAAEAFVGDGLAPGIYTLRLTWQGATIAEHPVQVDPAPTKVTLWTKLPPGPAPASPTPAPPNTAPGQGWLVGVLPHPTLAQTAKAIDQINQAAMSLGLKPIPGRTAADERRKKLVVFSFQPPVEKESQESPSVLAGKVVAKLLEEEVVAAAGPFVGDTAGRGGMWTQQIYLHLAPGTSMREATEIAKRQGLSRVERLPVGQSLFLATVPPERAFELEEILSRLHHEAQVQHAEPVPVTEIEADCCGDLWSLWDRCLVGSQDARILVDAPGQAPLLAIVDDDFLPVEELRAHPELYEADGSSGSRVVASLDFDRGLGLATTPSPSAYSGAYGGPYLKAHALMCLSIAAGRISGVAPSSRALLFKDPKNDHNHVQAWLWAGGLKCTGPFADLPAPQGGGVDIFCAAIGRYDITLNGMAAMRSLVVAGRRGRGCMLFFSAGNLGSEILLDRAYGALPFTLAIAASTCDSFGRERFAPYSGWGDVDLCAPSGTIQLTEYVGGPFDGVLGAAAPHCGKHPYRGMVGTWTTSSVSSTGSKTGEVVPVASERGFVLNSHTMLIGPDGFWTAREIYKVSDREILLQIGKFGPFPASSQVISASRLVGHLAADVAPSSAFLELDQLPLDPLEPDRRIRVGTPKSPEVRSYTVLTSCCSRISVRENLSVHCVGEQVYLDESHWNLCWGTSTATPLCAGTAALMLKANPRLSWVEVRHILRTTAVKIDRDGTGPCRAWLGRDGQPNKEQPYFSRRYGFGRLDAREAVSQAIDYDFPRDLMIRQFESDDGTSRVRPFGDSPDIWVHAHDPRSLAAEERDDPRRDEPVFRSRDSWIFARVRNCGRVESLEAWVRFYVAAGQEEPYCFPEDFELRRAEVLDQGIWRRGTQFLGEVKIVGVPPGEAQVVAVLWDPALIPPAFDSEGRPWEPHLLVAISPLDGPGDGVTMLDCNNLAQRTIEIREPE